MLRERHRRWVSSNCWLPIMSQAVLRTRMERCKIRKCISCQKLPLPSRAWYGTSQMNIWKIIWYISCPYVFIWYISVQSRCSHVYVEDENACRAAWVFHVTKISISIRGARLRLGKKKNRRDDEASFLIHSTICINSCSPVRLVRYLSVVILRSRIGAFVYLCVQDEVSRWCRSILLRKTHLLWCDISIGDR